ncbi:hypothetical protein DXT76_06970 [Halobacillus trueperi]|uniref:Glycosyltransferase RgtA/B/C/D-like domain-containing protein n=1 Tax=Halobacillus trueperi TaxID=156205 RepID=A0A3D8VR62_9BACI|nr:glycosyltransferase family 39 protein [Halobacillus trueperi]RDY71731.1 hypothetical protein DXT76_06970 [Halobacillus trueperi]
MISFLKRYQNHFIWVIVGLALAIRLTALFNYGLSLFLNSDDAGYISSAVTFLETGMLTYHDPAHPTVHIMPGQTVLLAGVFFFLGHGDVGIYAAKTLFILLGTLNVYLVYCLGKYIANIKVGLIAAFFLAIFVPQVLTDNLLLTETPFMTCLLGLIYFSIKLANEKKMSQFFLVMLFYVSAIMFKATIALYPFVLLIYLITKKYPFKLAVKQALIAIGILLITLGPWWVRNYIHYDEFIPLTGGSGNPLLLGTYQGHGYNIGEPYEKVKQDIKDMDTEHAYERLSLQKEAAIERIKTWWEEDPRLFLKSYIEFKTVHQWETQFYWIEIFNISKELINKIQVWIMYLGLASLTVFFMLREGKREYMFLLLLILYTTTLNNIFFSYDRYNQPFMFIIFLFVAGFLTTSIQLLKEKAFPVKPQ